LNPNVWEWTGDWYSQKHEADALKVCCIPQNPCGGPEGASYDSCQPDLRIPRKVLKSGSHLCAPNYCRRYRPAARHAEPIDTSASHVGFMCIREGQRDQLVAVEEEELDDYNPNCPGGLRYLPADLARSCNSTSSTPRDWAP
jgi:hypothetical protein